MAAPARGLQSDAGGVVELQILLHKLCIGMVAPPDDSAHDSAETQQGAYNW